jgi:hypothetical protein
MVTRVPRYVLLSKGVCLPNVVFGIFVRVNVGEGVIDGVNVRVIVGGVVGLSNVVKTHIRLSASVVPALFMARTCQ